MKVLVTGATGYLGSRLVRRLLSQSVGVWAVRRESSNMERLIGVERDISFVLDDESALKDLLVRESLDAIVHCATNYGRGSDSYVGMIESNVLFPARLIDAIRDGVVPAFININSCFERQIPRRLGKESMYLGPYSLTKYQFSQWGRLASQERGLPFIDLVIEHLYGPDDNEDKFVQWLSGQLTDPSVSSIELTAGSQRRDFIHVDDVIDAIECVIAHRSEFAGYVEIGVGSGSSVPLRTFVVELAEALHSKARLDFGARPTAPNEISESHATPDALLALGWRPKRTVGTYARQLLGEDKLLR